ncbi:hypothetical protein ACWC10_25825 [Streptomyces sp. NPDC001595]|uniref:hypothetical protein n=1 Tax=Streptomyces sp. NPDC001532 TaxID=3154520 RepID=UPI003329BDA8
MSDTDLDQVHTAVAALRTRGLELLDGFTDAELDRWPVEVPPAVRAVLREAGGVRAGRVRYDFGPRTLTPRDFARGLWRLAELPGDEGTLVVGVAGADWGPVIRVQPWDDTEVVVEASSFTDWLLGLGTERPRAQVSVPAVPSVAAAEGTDAELAALVAGGDPLTDVVDLRALPGLPCRVVWEPYYSLEYGTADTSGSETTYELVGDGRALLLHSFVSGDFLGRPVRRHRVPADAARLAVTELRALAAAHPDLVTLDAGHTDAELDTWPVHVPSDIRVVLREIGGVRMPGLPAVRLLPGAPEHAVDPEAHRMMGGDGSYWPVASAGRGRDAVLAQVRIDPRTGEWGYVVSIPTDPRSLGEEPGLSLIAESLPHLLLTVARIARDAVTASDFASHVQAATVGFFPHSGEPWTRPVPIGEWAGSDDPLRAALTTLPSGTHAADLRDSPIPTDLGLHRSEDWPYGPDSLDHLRFEGAGHVVAAVPRRR